MNAILWNRDDSREIMLKAEEKDKEWISEFLKFSDLDIFEYREYYIYLRIVRISSLAEIDSQSRDFKYLSRIERWIEKFNEYKSEEKERKFGRMKINGKTLSVDEGEYVCKMMLAMELADVENRKNKVGRRKKHTNLI